MSSKLAARHSREGWRVALIAGALSKGLTPQFQSGGPVAIRDRDQLRTPVIAASSADAERRADRRASKRERAADQRAIHESRKAARRARLG